jgi:hypothetical protein
VLLQALAKNAATIHVGGRFAMASSQPWKHALRYQTGFKLDQRVLLDKFGKNKNAMRL